jgi:hypothetical protein
MDDTSTNIAIDRARLGSSLLFDENQTVISGMTTDTPRSSTGNPRRQPHRNLESAAAAASASASLLLPHDKFRGGTASRFFSFGVAEAATSTSSPRRRGERSRRKMINLHRMTSSRGNNSSSSNTSRVVIIWTLHHHQYRYHHHRHHHLS